MKEEILQAASDAMKAVMLLHEYCAYSGGAVRTSDVRLQADRLDRDISTIIQAIQKGA